MPIEVLESGNADETSDLEMAKQVGDALNRAYPNHPWIVGFQGRNIVIRHMAIADAVHQAVGKEGFAAALPNSSLLTHKQITASAIRMGGQLLEAFKLPRGAWDGSDPVCPNWDASTPYKRKGFN